MLGIIQVGSTLRYVLQIAPVLQENCYYFTEIIDRVDNAS